MYDANRQYGRLMISTPSAAHYPCALIDIAAPCPAAPERRHHVWRSAYNTRHHHLASRTYLIATQPPQVGRRKLPHPQLSQNLTITQAAPPVVTVDNATRPYGALNPAFTSTVTGALNGDTFTNTYSTPAIINSPVGTYPINDVIGGPVYELHHQGRPGTPHRTTTPSTSTSRPTISTRYHRSPQSIVRQHCSAAGALGSDTLRSATHRHSNVTGRQLSNCAHNLGASLQELTLSVTNAGVLRSPQPRDCKQCLYLTEPPILSLC